MVSPSDANRRVDMFKLDGDLRDAYVELLSAQCAVDRIRHRYEPQVVAEKGNSFMVTRSISAAMAICEYFSLLQNALLPQAGAPPPPNHDQRTGEGKKRPL